MQKQTKKKKNPLENHKEKYIIKLGAPIDVFPLILRVTTLKLYISHIFFSCHR
jgi:hypothetical protein